MKLYLSSYFFGNSPEKLISLLKPDKKIAIIMNAGDIFGNEKRPTYLVKEVDKFKQFGFTASELELARKTMMSNIEKSFNEKSTTDPVLRILVIQTIRQVHSSPICCMLDSKGETTTRASQLLLHRQYAHGPQKEEGPGLPLTRCQTSRFSSVNAFSQMARCPQKKGGILWNAKTISFLKQFPPALVIVPGPATAAVAGGTRWRQTCRHSHTDA